MYREKLPESRHFKINKVADGVYSATHKEGGWAIGNAGIIDLGGKTLVFDSMMTPAAGSDLRDAATILTGRRVSYLVNSHYHNDHIWGNQAFRRETLILSAEETRQLITTEGPKEYKFYKSISARRLKQLTKQYRAETDETKRARLLPWLEYYQGLVESIPILNIRMPDLTFDDRLVLHGSKRSVELLALGGHTPSDAILFLPAERIVFTADLLFVDYHPFLADGDPQETISSLSKICALKPELLVPGHGPIGTVQDAGLLQEYINTIERLAMEMVAAGEPEKEIDAKTIPAPFDTWQMPKFFAMNLSFLYQREMEAQERAAEVTS